MAVVDETETKEKQNMSDTPRTTAVYNRVRSFTNEYEATDALCEMRDEAVKIERELTAAQAENNRLTTARALDVYRLLTRAEKGEAELAQLRADRETLRRLLNLAETVPYAERNSTEQAAIDAARKEGAK